MQTEKDEKQKTELVLMSLLGGSSLTEASERSGLAPSQVARLAADATLCLARATAGDPAAPNMEVLCWLHSELGQLICHVDLIGSLPSHCGGRHQSVYNLRSV